MTQPAGADSRDDGARRIVTLCMNPALDITTSTDEVAPTRKLRCAAARYDPGGGGINVARVAEVLGASATAVFPAGGPTGEVVTALLTAEGVGVRRIAIGGSTRESFTVDESSTRRQYRFVLPGPELTVAEQAECLTTLRTEAAGAAVVVASGSLPPGVPDDFYQQVADTCGELGTPLVLDTSGAGLANVRAGALLLKPSVRELRECMGLDLAEESEQLAAARSLVDRGVARHVLVSLGERGALLAGAGGGLRFAPLRVPPGSGVGAGDAMVAGVVVGLTRDWTLPEAVRLGVAASAAMLLTPGTAVCTRGDVDRLLSQTAEPVPADLIPGRP